MVNEQVLHMSNINNMDGVSSNFTTFHNNLSKIHDECFLEIVPTKSHRNYNSHPWITTAISKSCKFKSNLYKRWTRANDSPRGPILYEQYKFYRSKLRDIIREAKVNYFTMLFKKHADNIKKSWNVVNQIRCKMRK